MRLTLDAINIGLIIIAVLNTGLGFLVLAKAQNKIVKYAFSASLIAVVGWVMSMVIFRSADASSSLFWCKALYLFPTLIASSFAMFCYVFPEVAASRIRLKLIILLLGNIVMAGLVVMPNGIIREVVIRPGLEKAIFFGNLYVLYFLYIVGFFSIGFFELFKKFRIFSDNKKRQVSYILFGFSASANLAFVTNLIMPWLGYFFLNWLGQIFTIFLICFTSYAIITQNLLDIKLAFRKNAIYIFLTLCSAFLVYAVKYLFIERNIISIITKAFENIYQSWNGISLYSVPPLVSSVIFLILGALVWRKNKQSSVNKNFSLLCLVTFWWQFSWFILFNTNSSEAADFLVRLGYMGIVFISLLIYKFAISYTKIKTNFDKYFLAVSYIFFILLEILLFSSNYFISGYYEYFWGFYPRAGFLHVVYLLFLFSHLLRVFVLLARKMKIEREGESNSNQTKYVLLAQLIYNLAAFDFLTNYGFGIYPLGFIFILIHAGIIAYAIINYNLLSIKMTLKKYSVYLMVLVFLLFFVFAARFFFKKMTTFQNAIYILPLLFNITLAYIVYKKDSKSILNRYLTYLILAICFWIITLYLYYVSDNHLVVLYVGRLNFVIAEIIAFITFWFGYLFPVKTFQIGSLAKRLFRVWLLILTFVTLFTDLIVGDEQLINGNIETVFGSFYWIFVLHFAVFMIAPIVIMIIKSRQVNPIQKLQIKYFATGASLSAGLCFVTNILLPRYFSYYEFQHFGPILTIFLISFTAYAIVKHKLMDIKLALRKYVVFAVTAVIIVSTALVFKSFLKFTFASYEFLIDLGIIIFAVLFFPSLKKYFFSVSNKYFFSSLYDSRQLISEINNELNSVLEMEKIYNGLFSILDKAFHFKAFAILTQEADQNIYEVKFNKGFAVVFGDRFQGSRELNKYFIGRNKPIITSSVIDSFHDSESREVINNLIKLKVEVLIPMNLKGGRTIGVIALGSKEAEDVYNNEDMEVLKIAGDQVASSFENAMLYEEVKKQKEELRDWNLRLQEKVDDQTRELKLSQVERMSQLYRFAEFGKLSSGIFHDLVNPLTALSLNLELIKEHDKKEINNVRSDISQAVMATRKMESFIMALKKQISKQSEVIDFSLNQEISHVITILGHKARKNKVEIVFNSFKEIVIKGDPIKFNQIVSNLVSNAIDAYEAKENISDEEKTVTIRLMEDWEAVVLEVEDNGLGIEEENLSRVFEPFFTTKDFSRGTGIGLSSTKAIVEKDFGGNIRVESRVGEGSKFQVIIKKYF